MLEWDSEEKFEPEVQKENQTCLDDIKSITIINFYTILTK